MIGSQLVENTWSFKPIEFEESVIFFIKNISENVMIISTNSVQTRWLDNNVALSWHCSRESPQMAQ